MTAPHRTKPRDREPRPKSTREEREAVNRSNRHARNRDHDRIVRDWNSGARDNENEGH